MYNSNALRVVVIPRHLTEQYKIFSKHEPKIKDLTYDYNQQDFEALMNELYNYKDDVYFFTQSYPLEKWFDIAIKLGGHRMHKNMEQYCMALLDEYVNWNELQYRPDYVLSRRYTNNAMMGGPTETLDLFIVAKQVIYTYEDVILWSFPAVKDIIQTEIHDKIIPDLNSSNEPTRLSRKELEQQFIVIKRERKQNG